MNDNLLVSAWKFLFFIPRKVIGPIALAIPNAIRNQLVDTAENQLAQDPPIPLRSDYENPDRFDFKDFAVGVILILTLFGIVAGYYAAKNLMAKR